MASEPATKPTIDLADAARAERRDTGRSAAGIGPLALGVRRLRRNRTALAFGALFLALVVMTLAAPIWADQVAKTTPAANHLSDTIVLDGKETNVVSLDGVPIGPTWTGKFFLGADANGRDVMVRLLYGGRNSLLIGIAAAAITIFFSVVLGVLSGFFRGWVDGIIRPALDVLWAFPPLLLGIALGVSLSLSGLDLGFVTIPPGSKAIPILVIGVVGIPYLARPVRGQVLALREKEFIEAARAQGASPLRIMVSELLPNLASTLLVFFPLLVAQAVLTEAALSFLGAGVQPPDPSWGTVLADGIKLIITAPHLTVVPGLMLVATVLSLNVFGDGVRDALDPRAKLRIESKE